MDHERIREGKSVFSGEEKFLTLSDLKGSALTHTHMTQHVVFIYTYVCLYITILVKEEVMSFIGSRRDTEVRRRKVWKQCKWKHL